MARPLAKLTFAALLAANAAFDAGCTGQELQAAARIIPQVAQVATQVLNTAAQAKQQNANAGPAAPQATANTQTANNGFQAGRPEANTTLK